MYISIIIINILKLNNWIILIKTWNIFFIGYELRIFNLIENELSKVYRVYTFLYATNGHKPI